MTPAARLSAAIDILDSVLAGAPAEKELTTWARQNRYAGSKDRAAIRDLVFQALRCRRSFAALGGGESGRGLVLGGLRAEGADPAGMFTGEGYAPSPLTQAEAGLANALNDLPELEALDCPDALAPLLRESLGDDFAPVMRCLRDRAPVFLRVNLARITREAAQAALADEEIDTAPHPLSPSALEVTGNPRKVQSSQAYGDGLVELQDAASQALTDLLPLSPGLRVLDYCAGGGGKTLSMASREPQARYFAHDAAPQRMRDLAARAERAGITVKVLNEAQLQAAGRFDMVLCDVPCSGSGAWRRQPQAKWRFGPDDLEVLCQTQAEILDRAASLIVPGGTLAYATCSLLRAENDDQITRFLACHSGFELRKMQHFTPLDGGDGFFVAVLSRLNSISS